MAFMGKPLRDVEFSCGLVWNLEESLKTTRGPKWPSGASQGGRLNPLKESANSNWTMILLSTFLPHVFFSASGVLSS